MSVTLGGTGLPWRIEGIHGTTPISSPVTGAPAVFVASSRNSSTPTEGGCGRERTAKLSAPAMQGVVISGLAEKDGAGVFG